MNQEDIRRCGWCKSDPVYLKYHDEEWGREVKGREFIFANFGIRAEEEKL